MLDFETVMQFFKEHKESFAGVASLGTLLVLAFAVYQYRRAENWKGSEFVAKLHKDLLADPKCRRAMQMLESAGDRPIDFGNEKGTKTINHNILREAMRLHSSNDFTDLQIEIRETFDAFFSYMEQFERAIQTGLVSQRRVYPYFRYWIEILRGQRSMIPEVQDDFDQYLVTLGFEDAQKFLSRRWPSSKFYRPGQ